MRVIGFMVGGRVRQAAGAALCVVAAWLIPDVAHSESPWGADSEFQVNTFTMGRQIFPDAAADASGDFVVTWESGDFSAGWSIQAQRIGRTGAFLGTEFRVDSDRGGRPSAPDVAYSPPGTFLVAWDDYGLSPQALWTRLFASDGTPLADEVQINSYVTSGTQTGPDVAGLSDGGFVVAWYSRGSPGTDDEGFSVQARRLSLAGEPLGADFQVNSITTDNQGRPAVTPFADGTFVIAWAGFRLPYASVELRHLAPDAAEGMQPLGPERAVGFADGVILTPGLSWSGGEELVIAWEDMRVVRGKRTTLATSADDPVKVLSQTISQKYEVDVAAWPGGEFVAVWTDGYFFSPDGSDAAVVGRAYDSTGIPLSDQTVLNSYTTGAQATGSVEEFQDGGFVVVWTSAGSFGTDQSEESIQARIFGPLDPTRLFTDRFETGDTSRWSTGSERARDGLD